MPLDPYFQSPTQRAKAISEESSAMQIGRDDYCAIVFICPFPKGSEDAKEWVEGQRRERRGE